MSELRPLRVVHVIESLGTGGAEVALTRLLPLLRQDGSEHIVAAVGPPWDLEPAFARLGIPTHRLSPNGDLVEASRGLARLVRGGRYDLANAHLFYAELVTASVHAAGVLARASVTFHNFGYDVWRPETPRAAVRVALHRGLISPHFDARSAVCLGAALSYGRWLEVPPGQVLPLPLPSEPAPVEGPDATRARHGLPDGPILLMVGRLSWEKAHDVAVAALGLCPQGSADGELPTLVLAGDGPLRDELEARVASVGLQSRVRFLGPLTSRDVRALYGVATLLLLPSRTEALPLVAMEAMAAGVPVLAARTGGIPELVTHAETGWLVSPDRPDELASAIVHLLAHPELRRDLAEGAKRHVERAYGAARVTRCWTDYLETAAGRP